MKKIAILSFGLIALMLITSASPNTEQSKKGFEKIVFLELTSDQDSALFQPYSKAWNERWQWSSDVKLGASEMMNVKKYQAAFKDRTDNLWTILHPLVIEGKVHVYYPYAPNTYGMGPMDDGELRFPVMDKERSETFLTSEKLRDELCYFLGKIGPMSDFPLVDEYGDPLTVENPDGTIEYMYPPPEYFWYDDKEIVKYKLRVRIEVNKKGKEKKRVIEAFCPVVNRLNEMGEVVGEYDLLWFEFDELKSTLKENYFLDEKWKPISYRDYMLKKVKNTDFRN
jgi:hypothetical protein